MKENNRKYIEVSIARPKHLKRVRTGIKISPIGLVLICSMVAIGMLTGLLYQMFTITLEGDVTLTGQMKPLFSFDGTDFEAPYLNLTADLTELNSGETKTFNHYIINKDNGGWLVEVDLGDLSFYTLPEHEFYGLNITCSNWKVDGVPTTSHIVRPLENLSFDLVWSLHHEFVTAEDPFPSIINIVLTRTNEPPVVINDSVSLNYNENKTVNITSNDYDFDGDDITIVSFAANEHLIITQLDEYNLAVQSIYSSGGTHPVIDLEITVTDGTNTVVEHLFVTTYQP